MAGKGGASSFEPALTLLRDLRSWQRGVQPCGVQAEDLTAPQTLVRLARHTRFVSGHRGKAACEQVSSITGPQLEYPLDRQRDPGQRG